MGSGKSSVGRRLASITGHRFVDTDDLVTERAGRTIPEIFASGGEEAFRDLESAALADLPGICGLVVATGGGIVLREENREALRRIGIVAWVDASPDVLFSRVSRNNRRPLLQTENPRETFDAILSARRAIYGEAADLRVDSSDLSHDAAAHTLLEEALRFHSGHPRE